MKVSIDFSLYTATDGAFGYVSGEIDVVEAPQVGDLISLFPPSPDLIIEPLLGFDGQLKVTDRAMVANRSDLGLILALSDVNLVEKSDAIKLSAYLERAFNLFVSVCE